MAESKPADNHRLVRLNRGLSIVNVIIALFIFITPLVPTLRFYIQQRFADKKVIYSQADQPDQPKQFPTDSTLLIPSIGLEEKIHEGPTTDTLRQGVWRWPGGSTPDINNNTVLAGHLFTYQSPAVFYNLEKVKRGDKIAVYWSGKEYLYEVTERRKVKPNETDVTNPTDKARLTIYTCTPLWHPTHRFVLIAKLIEINQP